MLYKKSDQDDSYVTGKDKKKSPGSQKERKTSQKNLLLNGYDVQNRGVSRGESTFIYRVAWSLSG